ncbi:MAG: SLBB domain-containing protein [Candidatus Cloacimonetes bacterium]|nr:SLBB domain-containing protein [Candidatus Cloacimonadota bacterium]
MRIKLAIILILAASLLFAVEYLPPAAPTISVSITGFVTAPGVYQMLPVNRLTDVISLCGGVPTFSKNELLDAQLPTNPPVPNSLLENQKPKVIVEPDFRPMLGIRTVQLIRGGNKQTYDTLRFFRLGDESQNPFLKDGDIVHVPSVKDYVSIKGGVSLPGELQFLPGDKLEDIIKFANGTRYDADLSAVQIYRFEPNKIDFEVISLNLIDNPSLYGFELQVGDNCFVPQIAEVSNKLKVKIYGQVKNPGEYLITKSTTLANLIKQAGGINSRADLANLVYYNCNKAEQPNQYLEQLMGGTIADMTPIENAYLRTNLQQIKGKYSFDAQTFAQTNGEDENPVLRNGDCVFIPERLDMVWVSGQVRNPGLIPWIEGKNWDYYIKAAGGYTNNRKLTKGRIIRGDNGNWVKPKKDIFIYAGDTVFVPSQTDRSLWTDAKEGIVLVSSLITIIVGIRALTAK